MAGIGDANGFLNLNLPTIRYENPTLALLGLLLQVIGAISEENGELAKCWLQARPEASSRDENTKHEAVPRL